MRLFTSTVLIIAMSNSAFAATRGGTNQPPANAGGTTNPPVVAAAPTLEEAIKAQVKKNGRDPHLWDDVNLDGDTTLFTTMKMVEGDGTNGQKHGDCEAADTMVDTFSPKTTANGCQPIADVKAEQAQRREAARDLAYQRQSDWNNAVLSGGELRCHDVVTKDGAGQDVTINVCDGIAEINRKLAAVRTIAEQAAIKNTEQDTAIGSAQSTADAAVRQVDYGTMMGQKAAVDARQDATAKAQGDTIAVQTEEIATLWDSVHFTGYIGPSVVALNAGTSVTVGEDEESFAGERLAYGERTVYGVAGGIGGEWQWGGLMLIGTVGVGEHGNQVETFGAVAYFPWKLSGVVQMDPGLQVLYLGAGDHQHNTAFDGATSTLSGTGIGPNIGLNFRHDALNFGVRGFAAWGKANQGLVVALDESGDNVIEDQNASVLGLVLTVGIGGAPR